MSLKTNSGQKGRVVEPPTAFVARMLLPYSPSLKDLIDDLFRHSALTDFLAVSSRPRSLGFAQKPS
jgi:hypothetical protein